MVMRNIMFYPEYTDHQIRQCGHEECLVPAVMTLLFLQRFALIDSIGILQCLIL